MIIVFAAVLFVAFAYFSKGEAESVRYSKPLANMILTSPFGMRVRNGRPELHTGADFAASPGTPVFAAASGTVIYAADTTGLPYSPLTSRGGGNRIVIDHGDEVWSSYNHLSRFRVSVGDEVAAGQYIAESGGSPGTPGAGVTTGPHLHFEILVSQKEVDPLPVLASVA